MPVLFGRLKVWLFQEDLASADLNNEFNNILNNLGVGTISGDSQSVAQMQVTVNPGAVGSESLAVNIQGEIERLRFVIQRILGAGAAYWYSPPAIDLTTVAKILGPNQFQNGVSVGLVDANGQPMWLIPGVATNSVILQASPSSPFTCFINGVTFTFTANITLSGLTLAPGSNNTATVGNNVDGSNVTADAFSKNFGEEDSQDLLYDLTSRDSGTTLFNQRIAPFISLSSPGTAMTALDNTEVALKLTHGGSSEMLIAFLRGSATRAENATRGCMFNSSSVAIPRIAFATADTVTLLKMSWIFLINTGSLDVTYDRPSVGAQIPASPSTGDYWYDTANSQWKKYNGTAFVANQSVYVGFCAQDSATTVGARSSDPIAPYSNVNNMWIRRDLSSRTKATSNQGGLVSVYGSSLNFQGETLDYLMSRDQSGSFSAGDFLFLYLSAQGKQFVDNVAPNKRQELAGYYHPSRPYRCIAAAYTSDGTGFGDAGSAGGLILNSKSPAALKNRWQRFSFAGTTISGTSAANRVLETYKLMFRGGKMRITATLPYTEAIPAGSAPAQFTIANSGSNGSQGSFFIGLTDEQAVTTAVPVLTALNAASTPSAGVPFYSMIEIGPFSGFITLLPTIAISNFSAGTATATIPDTLLIVEEVF